MQLTRAKKIKYKNQGNYNFLLKVSALHLLIGTYLFIQINEIFVYDMSYSHIFTVTTLNVKKGQYKSAKTRNELQISKLSLFELVRPKDKNFI